MIKANIVVRVEDGNNVYNVGDRVRVLMKSLSGHNEGYEYIGKIIDIQEMFMTVDTCDKGCKNTPELDYVVLHYRSIDKMRVAKCNENFNNTWNFNE